MCLARVDRIYEEPSAQERIAWKVFIRTAESETLLFAYREWERTCRVPRGRWLKAEGLTILSEFDGLYPAGFHCFTSAEDAQPALKFSLDNELVPVKIRRVLVKGQEFEKPVLVAEEMYVPTEDELAAGFGNDDTQKSQE